MKYKVLRASELVSRLRNIEVKYQLNQPAEIDFNIHDTVKESADLIDSLLNIVFDIAKIIYNKEESK